MAYTAITIIFYNWQGRESGWIWSPLYTFWYPIRETFNGLIYSNGTLWWPDMIGNIYSANLWWFCVVFCVLAIIHILISYFTVRGDERDISRGISVFWKIAALLNKRFHNKQRLFVWCLLEVALFGGIGAYLYYGFHDPLFGRFLMYAAACHFALECYEFIGLRRFISR